MKPQVKESEKSRILTTSDYGLFVLPKFRVSGKFLQEIKESIEEKNLSKDYPILVEPNTYRVLDGRYRFLALKEKRLPIHYKVAEVTSIYDAVRVKNLVRKSDFELVINTFSDLLEPYNDIKVLCDLFPEMPVQLVIRATGTACRPIKLHDPRYHEPAKEWGYIDKKRFQRGKLHPFNFEETKHRLQTVSIFYSWLIEQVPFVDKWRRVWSPSAGESTSVKFESKTTWNDAFMIAAHFGFNRAEMEYRRWFIVDCRNYTCYGPTFYSDVVVNDRGVHGHRTAINDKRKYRLPEIFPGMLHKQSV